MPEKLRRDIVINVSPF